MILESSADNAKYLIGGDVTYINKNRMHLDINSSEQFT
jgi:hypothetical protein